MLFNRRAGARALAVTLCVMLSVGCEEHKRSRLGTQNPPDTSPPALSTSTSTLKRTVVVPTLDTPIPEGKSAIWCASFQIAWKALERGLTRGPAQVRNAEQVASRLNAAPETEADLEPADCFIATGPTKETIERIGRELPQRFPGGELPRIVVPPGESFLAFAFLKAGVRYTQEFSDNHKPFEFVDSAGQHTSVHSFGLLPDAPQTGIDRPLARLQVALRWQSDLEFAVDLCRDSRPYQVVLATLRGKGSLAEMLADEESQRKLHAVSDAHRLYEDHLLVPNMSWRINHHFQELEGPDKVLLNGVAPGWFIAAAVQDIQFKLDRRGAETVSSGYGVAMDGGPKEYYFNRPFLIYLKKRDADAGHPFFVMWVDNAEVMQPFEASTTKPRKK